MRTLLRFLLVAGLGTMLSVLLVVVTGAQPVVAPATIAAPENPYMAWAAGTILQMLTIATPVVVAWFSWKVNEWFGLKKDAELRDAFQVALDNAVGKMIQHTGTAAEALLIGATSRNTALAEGLKYLKAAVPDAIDHFRLTDGGLIEKLEAKLGLKLAVEAPKT